MKHTTKYVGLDVHQTTTAAVVREESGRVIARTILPTDEEALLAYVGGMRGAVHVALEEGTQAHWLCDLLTPMVARVLICDRRGRSATGNKDDLRDAADLAADLRRGVLRAVYHGRPERARLKEVARTYTTLVADTTRVMLRLKALFRARGIRTPGRQVYQPAARADWLGQLVAPGTRFRATVLYDQLDALRKWRPTVKQALVVEAQHEPAWTPLRTIPFLGPVRVALLIATLQTPWRFRTKRQLWTYAGLAVVTRTTAEYELDGDRPVRRPRAPMTRGLNRNYHRVVKAVLKSAATAAATRPGPLQEFYQALVAGGMRAELARLTLARKLAAVVLHVWKTGECYDAGKLRVPPG